MKYVIILIILGVIGAIGYNIWYNSSEQKLKRSMEETQRTIDALQGAMDATDSIIKIKQELRDLED